jgi:ABC-type branched-subunit amino acid transport system substrate-binding protein
MTLRKPFWRSVALAGVAGLTLAACGGGGDEGTTATETTAPSAPTPAPAKGDGELVIGTLLPQTGSLAFLGPPEFAGVDLAVKEINAEGGVLGKPMRKFDADSGDTTTNIASQSVQRLLSQKADAIIGAASSSVTLTAIDAVTGSGTLMFSPANTSIKLTEYPDKGLYWRTAPPDLFQGRVLGDLALEDGNQTMAILALQDAYGEGLAEQAEKSFTAGGGEVVEKVIYDPKASNYAAEVSQVKAADPDAIALISFDEAKKIIPELVKQGLLPRTKKVYFVDGDLFQYGKELPPGTLDGQKGTTPGAQAGTELRQRLLQINPRLKDFSYAAESYDATVLIALAAEAAKDDSGASIAGKLRELSTGGEKCKTFTECVSKVRAGTDVDYDGYSGPIEFDEWGNPTEATMGIYQYGPDNTYKNIDYVSGKVE